MSNYTFVINPKSNRGGELFPPQIFSNMNSIEEILKNPSATLIDVRSPMEYATDQLPGAMNIPVEQIQLQAMEIQKMSKPILVFCRSGARSGMALAILKQAGVTEVYNGGSIYDLMPIVQS